MDTAKGHLSPTDRKVHLVRAGVSVTALAKAIGFERQRSRVSDVIHNRRRSARIEAAICRYLGVDQAEWFPTDESEAATHTVAA